ncbi:hypothetical protein EPO33_01415 [Patescibacteria group bacterium]|nr:MAG: hypothetical protein EPO33_01415 [Patescibacteria group bacterium]
MSRDRVGSGSIPPEQRLDVEELWNLLLHYFRDREAVEKQIKERGWSRDADRRATFLEQWRTFTSLEQKVKHYVDRLPEELTIEIGLGVTLNNVALINAAHEEFVSWYYRDA